MDGSGAKPRPPTPSPLRWRGGDGGLLPCAQECSGDGVHGSSQGGHRILRVDQDKLILLESADDLGLAVRDDAYLDVGHGSVLPIDDLDEFACAGRSERLL